MTFKTLMIELAVGESNANLLKVSADLASKLDAAVIGIAGCLPLSLAVGGGYYLGEAFLDDHNELEAELLAAESEFRNVFKAPQAGASTAAPRWHAAVVYETISGFVSDYACEADLLITAGRQHGTASSNRYAKAGDLAMELGRPVLILPGQCTQLPLERALIAWSNTRETRRAIVDALPLLKLSGHVVIAQFVEAAKFNDSVKRLQLVAQWLTTHGVSSESVTLPSTGEDPTALSALIQERNIDLVVAGAYGHSRLREWVFGGVTRDLLTHDSHCSLLSH
jgi:nucleotide-binding universal stress UspA family protein